MSRLGLWGFEALIDCDGKRKEKGEVVERSLVVV